jgi:hypothetical protein
VPPAQSHVGVKRYDESSDQATAKVVPFPARTDCKDCKSADECDPRDNCLKEARATLEVDEIKRKSK